MVVKDISDTETSDDSAWWDDQNMPLTKRVPPQGIGALHSSAVQNAVSLGSDWASGMHLNTHKV